MLRKIAGRRDDEGENDRDLPIGIGEPGKLLLLLDDVDRIFDQLSETSGKDPPPTSRCPTRCVIHVPMRE